MFCNDFKALAVNAAWRDKPIRRFFACFFLGHDWAYDDSWQHTVRCVRCSRRDFSCSP